MARRPGNAGVHTRCSHRHRWPQASEHAHCRPRPAPLAAGQRTCALPTQKKHEDGQGPPTSRSASPAARGRSALFRHASSGRQLFHTTQVYFPPIMRIATWNINGLKACDGTNSWVGCARTQIDVVGLQETKTSDERIPGGFPARTPGGRITSGSSTGSRSRRFQRRR